MDKVLRQVIYKGVYGHQKEDWDNGLSSWNL